MDTLAALVVSMVAFNPPAESAAASPALDAHGAGETIRKLQEQVNRLQSEVDALKAQGSDDWLTARRADEIRGLVHEVLADADTRASLLQSGATAGYDKGFFLGSADGSFLLRIGGQLQVRAVYNSQSNAPVDDDRYGFEMRRTKVFFWGHVVDPSWQYQLELDASQSTGTFAIGEWAYVQKDLGNGWKIRAGQMKPPFLREEIVSSRRLALVERTLVNSMFTAGISQGVWLSHEADRWRFYATFNDGNNTRGTPWSAEDTEYAFTGRAEWLALGSDWRATDDYVGLRGGEPAALVGAAVQYQKSEFGTGSNLPLPDFNNAEVENLGLTVDVSAKFNGLSVAGALIYRNLQVDATGADLDQIAFLVQGGAFLTDDLEVVLRYEWGDVDISGVDDLSIVTVGINKYWDGHNLKWQSDFGYAFDSVVAGWAQDSAGWRADAPVEDGQVVIRSQLQLVF